jgi:hypothetical protein
MPAVPDIQPDGPANRAGDARIDNLCRLLASEDIDELQAALGQGIGMPQ